MSLTLAALAAHRFGYGPRPGELAAIASDPRGWAKAQLKPEAALPPTLANLPPCEDDILNIGRFYLSVRLRGPNAEQARARLARQGVSAEMLAQGTVEDNYRAYMRERYAKAIAARFAQMAASDRPVFERVVAFWSNHFTVSAAKPQVMSLPQSFEREVVRANACGRFETMLLASAKHPAMGVYLDNAQSIGPNSVWARNPRQMPRMGFGQGGRPTGLNENLAREILELHTLGVNGGYTQADVRALAALITGWNFERPTPVALFNDSTGVRSGAQLFRFIAEAHEPGAKTLLGKTYPEGLAGGEAALRDLARHPATARHLATKLVRHFVADTPPPACVDRVARAYQDSDGDLALTMAALIDSPEAWTPERRKFKRPDEYFISAMRMINARELPPNAAVVALETLGQRTYFAPGPDGWADTADAWLSADLVWKRLEWAQQLAERVARADVQPLALADATLGPSLSAETRQAIERAESPTQAMTLLLMSAEFQRR